jgi:hypothetical protein
MSTDTLIEAPAASETKPEETTASLPRLRTHCPRASGVALPQNTRLAYPLPGFRGPVPLPESVVAMR